METKKPNIQEFACPLCGKDGVLNYDTLQGEKIISCAHCGKKFSSLALDDINKKILFYNLCKE